MLRSLLVGLLLGPPEPATAPEFDEPVIIEAAPLVREPIPEPLPEFVEPIAMPPGPTTMAVLPPPPPPPDGAGRLVGGSLAIGLGIGAFVAVNQELRRDAGNPTYVAATFVPLGLASLGIGTYLLIRGGKARANFRHWKEYTGRYEVPPQGNGLLVAGTMLVVIGGVALMTGATRSTRGQQDMLTTALLSIGGAAVLAGGAQLTAGLVVRERHRRWRRASAFVLRPPWLAPIADRGLALGLIAEF